MTLACAVKYRGEMPNRVQLLQSGRTGDCSGLPAALSIKPKIINLGSFDDLSQRL